jgi:predicted nucleic acid-binding protein
VIVVDTSVWVETIRKPSGRTHDTLQRLISADEVALALPVRIELVAGISGPHRAAFVRALSALPLLVPSEDTWRVVEGWVPRAADAGRRFAVTDLLIAALAEEVTALVWSLDKDFDRLAALGLVQPYTANV